MIVWLGVLLLTSGAGFAGSQQTTEEPRRFSGTGVTGVATLLDPVIKPYSSIILQSIKQGLNESQHSSQPSYNASSDSSDAHFNPIDHIRLEASRTSEIKKQLIALKNLSSPAASLPDSSETSRGVIKGVVIQPLSDQSSATRETGDSSASEESPLVSECGGLGQGQIADGTNGSVIAIRSNGEPRRTASWLRNRLAYTVFFDLERLGDLSHHCVQEAHLHLHFTGLPPSQYARDDQMLLLLSVNKRSGGRRQQKMVAYQDVDSARPQNVTFNVTQYVLRWLRQPSKNKGLSLSLRSAYGLEQDVKSFISAGDHSSSLPFPPPEYDNVTQIADAILTNSSATSNSTPSAFETATVNASATYKSTDLNATSDLTGYTIFTRSQTPQTMVNSLASDDWADGGDVYSGDDDGDEKMDDDFDSDPIHLLVELYQLQTNRTDQPPFTPALDTATVRVKPGGDRAYKLGSGAGKTAGNPYTPDSRQEKHRSAKYQQIKILDGRSVT